MSLHHTVQPLPYIDVRARVHCQNKYSPQRCEQTGETWVRIPGYSGSVDVLFLPVEPPPGWVLQTALLTSEHHNFTSMDAKQLLFCDLCVAAALLAGDLYIPNY